MNCRDFKCGNHGTPGEWHRPGVCALCWTALHHPEVAKSLGKKHHEFPEYLATLTPDAHVGTISASIPLPVLKPPCRWLGSVLEFCNCQAAGEYNNIHACLHPRGYGDTDGNTTRHSLNNGAAWKCSECPGYERYEKPTTRNILFHLAPFKGTDWQYHARMMGERIKLFNGHRILATMMGPRLAHHREVAAAFPDFEVIAIRNDPRLREVATFLPLFERLHARGSKPGDVTLYAHGKGVTRGEHQRRWVEMLYGATIDTWPKVEKLLTQYPLAGPFLKEGRGWPANESDSMWHYSGSWFWFNNQELFAKDWRRIEKFWSGIEPYPSLHFPVAEAGCTFHRGPSEGPVRMNLYDAEYVNGIEAAYAEYLR